MFICSFSRSNGAFPQASTASDMISMGGGAVRSNENIRSCLIVAHSSVMYPYPLNLLCVSSF